ncbi:helix-turn-helix domain-containing protein [Labrys sp. ZIDIC5]|uniref:TetR/AcrR family transcriptional regulator n=1 Tax=Labrys sedimenti TaxID=3106036 RepID=UPI002ACA1608|nr:helix-turn-helix domain-containing protein [Labrys sp. ZIDIC5]MDZ5450961.1 helix-turn-helix domain-containing protein [Labrys sp. ZIDIC5]
MAELLEAAAEVIQERGFEATTMAEIAQRADARIGSLYRFFPSKDAVADALMDRYATVLAGAYDAVRDQAGSATPEQLADILIELLVQLHPQARAVTALLDSRTDWTQIRLRFRAQALAGVRAALKANAPGLAEAEADDIAAVVLNNMKTMVGMMRKDAPTTPGAPDQLRLMNRLYLGAKLTPARP